MKNNEFCDKVKYLLQSYYLKLSLKEGESPTDDLYFKALMAVNGGMAVLKYWSDIDYMYPKEKLIKMMCSYIN